MVATPYKLRCYDQLITWVEGISHHNNIDDECCPDFSCCQPEMFQKEDEIRKQVLVRFMEKNMFGKKEQTP